MPSRPSDRDRHIVQVRPPGQGRPQLGQMGPEIQFTCEAQSEHNHLPGRRQPTQRGGKRASENSFLRPCHDLLKPIVVRGQRFQV